MRTGNCENCSKISNPNIFHLEMIFTSDEPYSTLTKLKEYVQFHKKEQRWDKQEKFVDFGYIPQDIERGVRCMHVV